jgi:hypothetical protein
MQRRGRHDLDQIELRLAGADVAHEFPRVAKAVHHREAEGVAADLDATSRRPSWRERR